VPFVAAILALAGCSSGSDAPAAPSTVVGASATGSASDGPAPLPEASLGAQETTFVGVTMYLKSLADVPQQVLVSVAFRDNGKKFASAKVVETLRPHERSSILVKPDYSGPIPQGYVSAITSLKASVTGMPPSDAPAPVAPSPEVVAPSFSNTPEPTAEATPSDSSGEGALQQATGPQIESAGDYVCHAGIANLPKLQRGSPSGSDVESLQVVLDQLGYSPGPFDGQFGRRTEAAVRAFQADHQLSADGLVGPLTWTAIVNTYCA
jgi:hypothetical protein